MCIMFFQVISSSPPASSTVKSVWVSLMTCSSSPNSSIICLVAADQAAAHYVAIPLALVLPAPEAAAGQSAAAGTADFAAAPVSVSANLAVAINCVYATARCA
ncbi:hypothetical protein PUN28_017023 [Cardiocondyla obscurior]|uniref:Secreted protein n=1 Tax=Cardiocondyla obscurior TaxID=286306 RepID=A0AAW2EPT2_9HYME